MDTKEKITEVKFSCKQGTPSISAIIAMPIIFNIILKSHTESISVKYVSTYLFLGFLIGGIIFFSEKTAHVIVRKHELVFRWLGMANLSIDVGAIKSILPAAKPAYSSSFSRAVKQLTISYNDRTMNVSLRDNNLFALIVNRILKGEDPFKDIEYSEEAERKKSRLRFAAAIAYIVVNIILCSGLAFPRLYSIPAVVILSVADFACLILYEKSYQ